jgi:phage terminase small subunit
MARQLTDRQRKFCENLNRGMSATDAAKDAGYSPKWAGHDAAKILKNPQVAAYLDDLRTESRDESIADGTERRKLLTELMRGNTDAPFVTGIGLVDGKPDHGSRIKAAELLAKMDGDLAPVKFDINARVQTATQDWVARVLATVASVLGDEAAEALVPHLPVLELDR